MDGRMGRIKQKIRKLISDWNLHISGLDGFNFQEYNIGNIDPISKDSDLIVARKISCKDLMGFHVFLYKIVYS
jgi:hypothetical protein